MLKNSTIELLNVVEKLYKQEIEENGLNEEIGHGIEHIKGVVKRSAKVSQQIPEKDRPENFDDLVATVAALHDIGNLIDRNFHNIYSGALIRNSLNLSDMKIADISENPLQKGQLKESINAILLYYLKTNFSKEEIEYAIKNPTSPASIKLQENLATLIYNKEILRNDKSNYDLDNAINITSTFFNDLHKKEINSLHLLSTKQLSILQEIRDNLNENFTQEEIKQIIEAVEDHNRDFEIVKSGIDKGKEDKTKPAKARNIYGSIVFDADKDDNVYTFMIRSYLFVKNGLAKKKPHIFKDEKGNLINERVVDDIISQCAARFSLSKQNIKNLEYEGFYDFPTFAVASTADAFKDWAFASKVKLYKEDGTFVETDLVECVYNDIECYIRQKTINAKENIYEYEVYRNDETKEYMFNLKIDDKTKIPIVPYDMMIRYNSYSCGRDVRFQLPLPDDKLEKEERLEFYKLMTRYSDFEHYFEAEDKILTAMDVANRLTPEAAIDFFESPDGMEQVGLHYDAYKLSKEDYNKLVSDFMLTKNYFPPINDLINMIKKTSGKSFNWKELSLIYDFNDTIIYFFTKEAQLNTINQIDFLSTKENLHSKFIEEIKSEFGEEFIQTFGLQIEGIFEKEIASINYATIDLDELLLDLEEKPPFIDEITDKYNER